MKIIMRRMPTLISSVALILCYGLSSCSEEPTPKTQESAETSEQLQLARIPVVASSKIIVDGLINDWRDLDPIWSEAGAVGRGPMEMVDIRRVFMAHDRRMFYVFLECEPPLDKYFAQKEAPVALGDLYFDNDHDPSTGTKAESSDLRGYDIKAQVYSQMNLFKDKPALHLFHYILMGSGQDGRFGYKDWIKGGHRAERDEEHEGEHEGWSPAIRYGPNGVELAIDMQLLKIRPGQKLRILLREGAQLGHPEVYSYASVVIQER